MATGPWPGDLLRLLVSIEQTINTALNDTPSLSNYGIGVVVESEGEPIARLYEEGWDFK